MQFKIGKPPGEPCQIDSPNRLFNDNYGNIPYIGFAVGLVAALPAYAASLLFAGKFALFGIFDADPLVFLGSLLLIAIGHEAAHVLFHPRFGLSSRSCVGIYPGVWLPYGAYSGVVSRNRMLLMALGPILMLTVVPLMAGSCGWFPHLNTLLIWCAVMNAAISGADLYMVYVILRRIPRNNLIQGDFYGPNMKVPA